MRLIGLIFRALVSAALLYWILSGIDLTRLGAILVDVNPLFLAGAIALYFIGVIVIGAARWKLLLVSQGVPAPFAYLVKSYLVASFFNNLLPTNIGGDLFRIKDAALYTESKTLSTAVIFVDRLIGFAALFAIALGALAFRGHLALSLPAVGWLSVGLGAATAAALAVLALPELTTWLLAPLRHVGSDWVTARVGVVTGALFRFRRQTPALTKAFGVSFLIQGSLILFHFLVASALKIPLPFAYCFLIVPLCLIVQLLPSINGFGVRESAFVFFFGRINLGPEQAVSLSFVSTGMVVLLSLLGGAIYATRRP